MKQISIFPSVRRLGLTMAFLCVPTFVHGESQVVAWGMNSFGPTNVPPDCTNIVAISSGGGYFNLALRADGTVTAWGENSSGQTNVPAALSNVVAIAAGEHHALALRGDGSVVAWGGNEVGQASVPPGLTNVATLVGGPGHSIFVRANGDVVAIGQPPQGTVPADITNGTLIAAGWQHSLAVKNDGIVRAWGQSDVGATNVPADLSNVVAIAAATRSMALQRDGTVIEWGTLFGPFTARPPGIAGVTAIAAGGRQSIVAKSDGSVAEWGIDMFGGGTAPALTNALTVAAGNNHRMALLGSGSPVYNHAAINWTVPAGGAAQFGMAAAGAAPLGYQWRFNGTNLSGATNSCLRLTGLQATNAGNYTVVISNAFDVVTSSPPALLTVLAPPVILGQPSSLVVTQGNTAAFTVTAAGSFLNYQWRFNGTNISGATGSALTITNAQVTNIGLYAVVITNTLGSVTSSPAAVLALENVLVVLTPPQSQTVFAASNATFSVTVAGASPAYQWRLNGTNLPGETASVMTVTNAQSTNAGNYVVVVSNYTGSVTSSPAAALTVQIPGIVSRATDEGLRLAMAFGGTVTFVVDGNIVLSNPIVITNDTILDASGRGIVVSGNNATRVFQVNPGVQFTLKNLTVANGRTNLGAGIYNSGGVVTITNCTFTNNQAIGAIGSGGAFPGAGQAGSGGAIHNTGNLVLLNSSFSGNSAAGGTGGSPSGVPEGNGGPGGDGMGGVVYNIGNVAMTNCVFSANGAFGGNGGLSFGPGHSPGAAGAGHGGVAFNQGGGSVQSANCALTGNVASGGTSTATGSHAGTFRGLGRGGAILNATGNIVIASAIISGNLANGSPASGGGIQHLAGVLTISGTVLSNNNAAAATPTSNISTAGYPGSGGGLYNSGTAMLTDCTINKNSSAGGNAVFGSGGEAKGGGAYNSGTIGFLRCTLTDNTATGAQNGAGYGGGVGNDGGQGWMVNCTVAFNSAVSAAGARAGGGIWSSAALTNCTLFGNRATGGNGGNLGGSAVVVVNSILAAGLPNNGGFVDQGHNLVTTGNPKLGPLDYYGGFTKTMPLLAGSAALDAADNASAPPTDQRGRSRPSGAASDIGAFESSAPFRVEGRFLGLDSSHSITLTLEGSTTNVASGGSFRFDGLSAGTHFVTSSIPPYVVAPNPRMLILGPDVLNADFIEYEWNSVNLVNPGNGPAQVIYAGTNGQTHRLFASSNLVNWVVIGTNTIGPANYYEVIDPAAAGQPARFYRSVSP